MASVTKIIGAFFVPLAEVFSKKKSTAYQLFSLSTQLLHRFNPLNVLIAAQSNI
jgi:hypothetical protein